MANYAPPSQMNGISRPGKGMTVVKPKDMKGTLRRLFDLVRGSSYGFGWILVLSALASGAGILSPYITGLAVKAVQDGSELSPALTMLLVLYLADWLVRFMQQFLMASVGQKLIMHIRKVLFEHVLSLPLSFFDRGQHGELMSRLTNDVDNISTTISNSLTLLLTYAFTIVGIFVMMIMLSPLLTLVSLAGVVLVFILTKVITGRTKALFAEQQKRLGLLNGQIEESISGLNVVKAFGREREMETDFSAASTALCEASVKALTWSGYLMPLMNVINNLSYLAIAVFSGLLFLSGGIADISVITSFLLYVRRFTRPFVEIANVYNNFQTAVAGAERVFEILDKPREPEDRPDAFELSSAKGDIVFDHVSFGYTPEKTVLHDICLDIKAGTQVAIVGPTGSGKTTVINLLTRFYDVTEGAIYLDGHDLRDYRMKDLRDAFSVVLQDTNLFACSVRDNIGYSRVGETEEEIVRAARMSGADSFIERLPQGYDTLLDQGGMELSQGERQLLTIARAILADSPIMILDEATSSVDTVTEQKIRRAMLAMCEGRTSFIIAHRLSTIRDSDLIILIEAGEIREMGTHDELMAQNGKYAEMYRVQTGKEENDL